MKKNLLRRINYIDDIYNDFRSLEIKDMVDPRFWNDFIGDINSFKNNKKYIDARADNDNNSQVVLKVGIFGTFNTGKSSIINSILNEKVLLDDVSPSTALVSILKYDDTKKIILCYRDGEKKEISEEEFKVISNHQGEELQDEYHTIREKISHIEIYYPCEILRNINLIDTPGFSSVSERDDNITKGWIEDVDILLWTFDVNKGSIQNDELNLLNYVSSKIGSKKIIAILNKIDSKPHSEREKILNTFKEGFDFYMLIPYSAKSVLKNVIGSKENKDLICQLLSDMVKDNVGIDEKILTLANNKAKLVVNNELAYEKNFNKIKNDEHMKGYAKLKEYLINLHSKKKNLEADELSRMIKKIYLMEVNNLHLLKQKLESHIENLIEDKEASLNSIDNFEKEFFSDFNLKFDIYRKKLYNEIGKLLRIGNGVDDAYKILHNVFNEIHEYSFENIDRFIRSNEFDYSAEEKSKELKFFIGQLIGASFNSVKGMYNIYKKQSYYPKEETLDLIIPTQQYKRVLKEFYIGIIKQLREQVINMINKKIEILDGFVNKVECVLVMENYQSNEFQSYYRDSSDIFQEEVAITVDSSITNKGDTLFKKKNYLNRKSTVV